MHTEENDGNSHIASDRKHPLFSTLASLSRFIVSGDVDPLSLASVLKELIRTFVAEREHWQTHVGQAMEEYLETFTYFFLLQIISLLKQGEKKILSGVQDRSGPEKAKRRPNFPKSATERLESWLIAHSSNPYPTTEEKNNLCELLGLTMKQLNDWFINARRRKLPR